MFVLTLILFLGCSFLQRAYEPIQDIVDMDAPETEGITMLHMDNPVMRYVAAEETAKAYIMVAAIGVAHRYGYGGMIYLFAFVLFSSLWSLAEQHFMLTGGYDARTDRILMATSHYFTSYSMMYVLTLVTYFISRFVASATEGELGIFLAVVGFLLYVVFLGLSLPFYIAWFLDWLGEGLFIWLMFFGARRISSEAAVFSASTVKELLANPAAIVIFALIFVFDRLWAEYVRPYLYMGMLGEVLDKLGGS